MRKTPDTATRERLETALAKLLERQKDARVGCITISAVAREIGVSPALIHNCYPDLAARIRAHMGREERHRSDRRTELSALGQVVRELRERIVRLEADLAKIASVNAALTVENVELRAMVKSGNILSLPRRSPNTRL